MSLLLAVLISTASGAVPEQAPSDHPRLLQDESGLQPGALPSRLTLRELALGKGAASEAERARAELKSQLRPPTTAFQSFLASFLSTAVGTVASVYFLEGLLPPVKEPLLQMGLSALSLTVLSFAPGAGNLLNEDNLRFVVHGLIRMAVLAVGFGLLAHNFAVTDAISYGPMALGVSLLGFGISAVWDVAASPGAPDRWVERELERRNAPGVKVAFEF